MSIIQTEDYYNTPSLFLLILILILKLYNLLLCNCDREMTRRPAISFEITLVISVARLLRIHSMFVALPTDTLFLRTRSQLGIEV